MMHLNLTHICFANVDLLHVCRSAFRRLPASHVSFNRHLDRRK